MALDVVRVPDSSRTPTLAAGASCNACLHARVLQYLGACSSSLPPPDPFVLWCVHRRQFFVEIVASAAFGASLVGGAPLSEWLQAGNMTTTLFAGLFRPVASLRQRIAQVSARIFPSSGQVCFAAFRG